MALSLELVGEALLLLMCDLLKVMQGNNYKLFISTTKNTASPPAICHAFGHGDDGNA